MPLIKRRKMARAFERSPYEALREWTMRNTLVLIGAVIMGFLWIAVVHVFVDKIMNFIATGGSEFVEPPWDPDSAWVVGLKVGGAIIVGMVTAKMQSK